MYRAIAEYKQTTCINNIVRQYQKQRGYDYHRHLLCEYSSALVHGCSPTQSPVSLALATSRTPSPAQVLYGFSGIDPCRSSLKIRPKERPHDAKKKGMPIARVLSQQHVQHIMKNTGHGDETES